MFSSRAKLHPNCVQCMMGFIKRSLVREKWPNIGLRKHLKGGCLKINSAAVSLQNTCFLCSDGEDLLISLNKLAQHKSHYRRVAFPDRAGEERDGHRATKCEHKQISKLVTFFFLEIKMYPYCKSFHFCIYNISLCVWGGMCVSYILRAFGKNFS